MKDLIVYLARNLVDDASSVQVSEVSGDRGRVYELRVAADDRGKIIGRQGRTIRALRALVSAAATRDGKRVVLEVVE